MPWKMKIWKSMIGKEDGIKESLNEIFALKKQLVELGFEADEVEYIIHENAEMKRISQWDLATVKKIKKALNTQLNISRSCLELVQNKKPPKVKKLVEVR
ncbi:MAG: hypothetical protein PHT78_06270 [Desulfitobacteriaceae bacterium]|nr:hypothetical protein [Desulfitobacteriaceae bacterium]